MNNFWRNNKALRLGVLITLGGPIFIVCGIRDGLKAWAIAIGSVARERPK